MEVTIKKLAEDALPSDAMGCMEATLFDVSTRPASRGIRSDKARYGFIIHLHASCISLQFLFHMSAPNRNCGNLGVIPSRA